VCEELTKMSVALIMDALMPMILEKLEILLYDMNDRFYL
jgi:hypothetical protein